MTPTHGTEATADEPLLACRFSVPSTPAGLVVRPRLFSLLTQAATVTVVQAPAGWGKTVLAASWLRLCTPPNPVGWLSVEREDGPADFWRHLCAAVQAAAPAGRFPDFEGLANRRFLTRLTQAFLELPRPLILVVDEADHPATREIEQDLGFVLEHGDGHLRLVALCRDSPPVPVHRWRLRCDLTEMGTAELGFTLSETADLLDHQGVASTADQTERLWHQTEGWPAGVQMTAAAMRRNLRHVAGGAGDADAYIADYLIREVLAEQPEYLLDVSLDMAIVPRMCASLIEAVAGRQHSDQVLNDMLAANLVVEAPDTEAGWYRYHRSFGQVLRAELNRRRPASVPDLHRRAAAWLVEHAQPLHALQHAVAGQDWAVAKRVLTDHWCELIGYDYPELDIPSPQLAGSTPPDEPELALACALERLTRRDPDHAAQLLRMADRSLERLPAKRRHRLQLIAAAIDLSCARQHANVADQNAAVLRMLDLLPSGAAPSLDDGARAIALTALGRAQMGAGALESAEATLASGLAFAARARLAGPRLAATSELGVVQALRGELHAAERTARVALAMPTGPGDRSAEDARAHLARAITYLHWDKVEQATSEMRCALAAIGHGTDPGLAASIAIVCAELMRQRGELVQGMDMIRSARRETDAWTVPQHLLHWLDTTEADLACAHGDGAAARLALLAAPVSGDIDAARRTISLARTYLRDGDPASALDAVAPWTDNAIDSGCPISVRLDTAMLHAVAAHRLGDIRGSTRALERVLRLAEPDGFRRIFTAGGPEVHEMLLAHLDSGTAYWSLVANLVAEGRTDVDAADRTHLLEALSERELTVLRYLQSILSNAEIAAEMSISVNTVKTHVRNIYRKLDTDHRSDAVRRARSLQLL